ncbi:hypothetical protein LCGC14_0322730 [marine sediment metagenome]|uniref:Uncharacterized protein n=1 Tax=marine sediment metagenome TaxID=412755 RepID=A0A0F9TNZ9_9ZZZZ
MRVVIAKVVAEAEAPDEPEIKIKDLRVKPEVDPSSLTPLHILLDLPSYSIGALPKPKLRPFLKPTRSWWSQLLHGLWNCAAVFGVFIWVCIMLKLEGCV